MDSIYPLLKDTHSFLRWVILVFLLLSIFRQMTAGNQPFGSKDKAFGLPLLIAAHLNFLIGLYQYIAGPWGFKQIQDKGMGAVMKDSVDRFWSVEHPFMMLLGVIFITIAYGQRKSKHTARIQHRRALIFFSLALIAILLAVPWPGREGIERPWFPGVD